MLSILVLSAPRMYGRIMYSSSSMLFSFLFLFISMPFLSVSSVSIMASMSMVLSVVGP